MKYKKQHKVEETRTNLKGYKTITNKNCARCTVSTGLLYLTFTNANAIITLLMENTCEKFKIGKHLVHIEDITRRITEAK